MRNITKLLTELSRERPVFHSEADFQHALAWEIHRSLPKARVRLEYRIPQMEKRAHLDIWVNAPDGIIVMELKYKTRAFDVVAGGEDFELKDQAAQDIGRYDSVKDIERLEWVVTARKKAVGYAILLTNDSTYWKAPSRNTVDRDFRLHDGQALEGTLRWKGAGPGTMRGRELPVSLTRRYALQWRDYSDFHMAGYSALRYLEVRVV